MKKRMSFILAVMVAMAVYVAACEELDTASIVGNIEDGVYVLTVTPESDDDGAWRADEMTDDTVVRLGSSGMENGVFTVRYEPVGDGETSVFLRHFNAHTCDQMMSFDLLVKDGKVQEVTGGSGTASPSEEELDPYFSGKWMEKDTQFTTLDVTKNTEDGWTIEFTSPMSHGAWMIRANAYYDCDEDAFLYVDGVKYDLLLEDGTAGKETDKNLCGKLGFVGDESAIELMWYTTEASGNEGVLFERDSGSLDSGT